MTMTFENYYSTLNDKMQFAKRVAKMCSVSLSTVRNWGLGYSYPAKPEHLDILERETGIPKSELFA